MFGDDALAPRRIFERGGADVDPAAPGGQSAFEARVVAKTARQFDVQVQLLGDRGDHVGVRTPPERGVEVDQMQPLGTRVLPAQRGGERVAEHLFRAGDALGELNRLAVLNVDGGQQGQCGHEARA